ncbi:pyridoxal phosphate-dependent transferase [Annulohypoxylon moriforme]|nr:pyridoxal phosphate-dependent transferase [Annulohypoxylon moriforme]
MFQHKIAALEKCRAQSAPLPSGAAPYTSSTHFKVSNTADKPASRSWDHRFSKIILGRSASVLKASQRLPNTSRPMIPLGTARPTPEYYPWDTLDMTAAKGVLRNATEEVVDSITCKKGEEAYDLSVAMNYGYAAGCPQLLRYITEHVEMLHNPPYRDWECSVTCGTTSAIDIVLRIFCNPGDWIITEAHTYSCTVDAAKSQGLKIVGIDMDDLGLCPSDLDEKLETWPSNKGPRPFLLYMIPSGQNPTGTTQSAERRKAIYEVAEKHDLYILEDDPYFYLQLHTTDVLSPEDYIGQLQTSYLSLDTSGRVLRLDSTSKILAPGLRAGWLTASSDVVERFLACSELSTVSPSGPSQVLLYKLLEQAWGHEGFINWLARLSAQYSHRRNVFIEACHTYLPIDICSWLVPREGMFLWLCIDVTKHPDYAPEGSASNLTDLRLRLEDRIYTNAREKGVLVSKGGWFTVDDRRPIQIHFRATFAAAPIPSLADGIKLFSQCVREEFLRLG